jgi:hypothetical protein
MIRQALDELPQHEAARADFAARRAAALLADHERVRASSKATGSYAVHALLPPDVIALFVLLPKVR